MAVTLTENAAKAVQRVMQEQQMPEGTLLRVGISAGGCSGFNYALGFDDVTDAAKDQVTEQHGIKMAVDKQSALYLDGTTIDYYSGIDRQGFTFDNPNAVKSCGCGSSFSA